MALRRLWFPLALLLFMVPLPEVTIADLNFHLKMLATDWGVALASRFGAVAERMGNRVLLREGKMLVVANAKAEGATGLLYTIEHLISYDANGKMQDHRITVVES